MINFLFLLIKRSFSVGLTGLFFSIQALAQTVPPVNDTSLEAWYLNDGTTSAISPITNASPVDTWINKSVITPHAKDAVQPYNVNYKPTVVASSINGKGAVHFDGTDDFIQAPSVNSPTALNKKTVFVAFKTPTSFDTGICHSIFKYGTLSSAWGIYLFGNQAYFNVYNSTPGSQRNINTAALSPNTGYIITMVFNSDAGIMEGYLNGDFFGSVNDVGTVTGASNYSLAIGGFINDEKLHLSGVQVVAGVQNTINGAANSVQNNASFNGDIAEVLHYNQVVLTTKQRKDTEEYLMTKYGILHSYACIGCLESNKENILWYKTDNLNDVIVQPSTTNYISAWKDASGNNLLATQNFGTLPIYTTNAINGRPALNFTGSAGANSRHSYAIPNNNMMNALGQTYPGRSWYFAIKTSDVVTRQVIYKEGDNANGMVVYLLNSKLYTYFYATNNGALSGNSVWANITTGTKIVSLVVNDQNVCNLYLDGTLGGGGYGPLLNSLKYSKATVSPLVNTLCIGSSDETSARFHDGLLASSTASPYAYFPYNGFIAEIGIMNKGNSEIERKVINNQLALKFGVTVLADDIYRWQEFYTTQLGGIGNVGNVMPGTFNSKSCSDILFFSEQNPGDNKIAFIANDNAGVGYLTGFNSTAVNAPKNVKRSLKIWRADVTTYPSTVGGTKEIIYSVKNSDFPLGVGSLEKAVLLVDKDGDFSKGSKVYVMNLDGPTNTYIADHILTDAGDYISIGVLNEYEFSAIGTPIYSNAVDVFGMSDRGYTTNSLTSTALKITSPSSVQAGDYLLLGANNSIALSLNGTGPYINMSVLNRNWRVNQYGDVGTVEVQFDPSLVSGYTLPSDYDYVLMIDRTGTGNYTTSSIMNKLVNEGGKYRAFNIVLKDRDVITIAAAQQRAAVKTKNTTVVFRESTLDFTNSVVKTLTGTTVNTFPSANPCTQLVNKPTLYLTLNTGDDYLFGTTSFTTTVNVALTSTDGGSYTNAFSLTIDNSKPEQVFTLDLSSFYSYSKDKEFTLSVSFAPAPSNATIKSSIVMTAEIKEEVKTTVSTTPATLIKTQSTAFISVNRSCQFNWTTEFCDPASYEFQLLRLYNTQTYIGTPNGQNIYNAELDWSKALSMEVVGTSLNLTLAEGTGYYMWRVRPIGNYYDGGIANNQNWGNWSSDKLSLSNTLTVLSTDNYVTTYQGSLLYYTQFDEDKNFIYSRIFTENGNIHEGITYANGLQQGMQIQSRIPSNGATGQVIISETLQDLSGRPAMQTLATPDESGDNLLGYRPLALISSATGTKYSALNFDKDANFNNADELGNSLINIYYSNTNTDPQVPNAEKYPYSRVLNDNDGLNRPKEQSGVGPTHKIGQKSVKIAYSAVNDAELIRMFGDEAPKSNSVFKTLTTDQNDVTSVSYTDKEGKVLATALVKKASQPGTNLIPLDITDTEYTQLQKIDNNTDLPGGGVRAAKPFVFTVATDLEISISVTKTFFPSMCDLSYCQECSYKALITVINQADNSIYSTSTVPITGNQIACSTAVESTGTPLIVSLLQVPAGKYLIQKTIVLDNDKAVTYAQAVAENSSNKLKTSAVYATIQAYLTAKNIEGLNTYLFSAIGTTTAEGIAITVEHPAAGYVVPVPYQLVDGDKVVLTSSCCSLKIPIMVPDIDPCKKLEATVNPWTITDFSNYLIQKYKDVNGGVFDLPFTEISPTTTFIEQDFRDLIANMYAEPVLYHDAGKFTCQKVWDRWNGQLQTKGLNTALSSTNPSGNLNAPNGYGGTQTEPGHDNLTGQPGWVDQNALNGAATAGTNRPIINQFLDCVGRNYVGFLVNNTDSRLKTMAYKLFYYPGRDISATIPNYGSPAQAMCENVFCKTDNPVLIDRCNANMCKRKVVLTAGSYYTLEYETTTANNYVPLSSTLANNQYSQLYQCIKSLPAVMPANAQLQHNALLPLVLTKKKQMQDDCNGACDTKRDAIILKLKKLYDPTGSGIYKNGANATFLYEDLCCTADRLVEYCKDQCYLSVLQYTCPNDVNDPYKLLSLGTPEENNTLMSILYGDFDITDPTNTATPCTNASREAKVCYQSAGLYHLENTTDIDASGSFASLVVNGSNVLTTDRFNAANKAFNLFNGYAVCASDNSRAITNNVTVSAWVQRTGDNNNNNERIIVQKFDGVKGFKLFTKGDYVYFDVYDNIGLKSSGPSILKLPLSSGTDWHFVTGIARDTSVEVWIDGEYSAGLYGVTVGSFSNTANLTIGHTSLAFAGKMDEVYLYACPMGKGAIFNQYLNTRGDNLSYIPEQSVSGSCATLSTQIPNRVWDIGSRVFTQFTRRTKMMKGKVWIYGCTNVGSYCQDYITTIDQNKKLKEIVGLVSGDACVKDIVESSDGNYFVAIEKKISSTSSSLYLIKMNEVGDVIWQTIQPSEVCVDWPYSYTMRGDNLRIVQRNNLVYAVWTSEGADFSPSVCNSVGSHIMVYKYNAVTGIQTSNKIDLTIANISGGYLANAVTTNDALFVITNDTIQGGSIYVTKINLNTWTTSWSNRYGGSGRDNAYYAVLLNNNNNLLISGTTNSPEISGCVNYYSYSDLYHLNIKTTDGSIKWSKAIGVLNSSSYYFNSFSGGNYKLLSSGNVILPAKLGVNSVFHILSNEGLESQYTYTPAASYISYGITAAEDKDGYVILVNDLLQITGKDAIYKVIKLDFNFNKLWERTIQVIYPVSVTYNGILVDLNVYPNGSYVITGSGPNISSDRQSTPYGGVSWGDQWFLNLGYQVSCTRRPVCIKWKFTPPPVPAPTEDPVVYDNQLSGITRNINEAIISQLGECTATNQAALLDEYKTKCNSKIKETVTAKYKINTEHYTLYYYDRSGNLVKTIPPDGVRLLPVSDPVVNADVLARKTITNHKLETTYKYNSLGQLTEQKTPDAGVTKFLYNKMGMLRFSQNAQQAIDNTYSYTKYDELGRLIEVGQASSAITGVNFSALDVTDYLDGVPFSAVTAFGRTSYPTTGTAQETYTVYSDPAAHLNYLGKGQRFVQNRVSYTFTKSLLTGENAAVTCYSYDPHGNVEWLVQDLPGFSRNTIGYEYDLISNKVVKVKLNEKRADQFFHCYSYDADNRITGVKTSSNGYAWDMDARYKYYKHGPLKRTELGEDKIQGMDYTYTLHGWLKSVNAPTATITDDPGQDAQSGNLYGQDEYGFVLGYYDGDFSRSGSILNSNTSTMNLASTKNLYNGNIKTWVNRIPEITVQNAAVNSASGQAYEYDYLNRIKSATHYTYNSGFVLSPGAYNSTYSYDPNGNLKSLMRNGSSPVAMDNLVYNYGRDANGKLSFDNRLNSVVDDVNATNYSDDIDGTNAYTYDAIGNLKSDVKQLNTINWTVYGKISEVKQQNPVSVAGKPELRYVYDASGNRVAKETNIEPYTAGGAYQRVPDKVTTSYYVRDAGGNVMAIYNRKNIPISGSPNYYDAVYTLKETSLYGSSRLGNQDERSAEIEIGRKKFFKDDMDKVQMDFSSLERQTEAYTLLTSTSSIDQIITSGTYKIPSVKLHRLSMGSSSASASALQSMNAIAGVQGGDISVAELESGSILFYTATFKSYWGKPNVLLLFDQDGKLMLNSAGINASAGSRNAIVRMPGDDQKYVLVTRGTDGKLYSHTIDMTLKGNGGTGSSRGDVVSKNNVLDANTNYGSHLVALENYVTGISYVYATRYTTPSSPSVLGKLEMVQFEVSTKGTSIVKKPVVMCTNIDAIREMGESEMQLSPDTKKILLYNHLMKLGWFSVQRSEVNVFNLGADFKVTGNYLVDRVRITTPATTASQSADFSSDSRFVYYGSDRLTLTGSTPTDKELSVYDLRENINLSLGKAYNGNIRRAVSTLVYTGNTGSNFMPGYKQDATTASFTEGVVGDRIAFAYLPAGNALTGIVTLQNAKILRKSDWNSAYMTYSRRVGSKQYELTDHLGNVAVMLSDRKIASPAGLLANKAEVKVYNSYYPFGMAMPGLQYKPDDYRYGFNGKEKDKMMNDQGNVYDYGFRIYNPQIAKFLSVDPLTQSFPWYTPYQFAGNTPIMASDLDGLEERIEIYSYAEDAGGCMIERYTSPKVKKQIFALAQKNYAAYKISENSANVDQYLKNSSAPPSTGILQLRIDKEGKVQYNYIPDKIREAVYTKEAVKSSIKKTNSVVKTMYEVDNWMDGNSQSEVSGKQGTTIIAGTLAGIFSGGTYFLAEGSALGFIWWAGTFTAVDDVAGGFAFDNGDSAIESLLDENGKLVYSAAKLGVGVTNIGQSGFEIYKNVKYARIPFRYGNVLFDSEEAVRDTKDVVDNVSK